MLDYDDAEAFESHAEHSGSTFFLLGRKNARGGQRGDRKLPGRRIERNLSAGLEEGSKRETVIAVLSTLYR